jgi:rhodanese-related sulfurtransferase
MMELKNFSPREAYAAYLRGTTVLDVREQHDARSLMPDLKKVTSIPMSELTQRLGELAPNRPVVLLSNVGNKGKDAARFLLKNGYQDVAFIDGGARAWMEDGLPLQSV